MSLRKSIILRHCSLMVLLSSAVLRADIMPADRRTVWDPGIPGGIPPVTAVHTVVDASTYGDGVTDATAVINAAIQAAGDVADSTGIRLVVYLPAGTYRVSDIIQLNRSDVVLRGAGPTVTRIISESESWGISFGRVWPDYPLGVFDVLEDALKGSTSLVVSNANGAEILVDHVLQLDQQDPTAVEVVPGELWMNEYVWLGDGHYHKRQPEMDTNGPGTEGAEWTDAGSWMETANYNARYTGPWRSVCQQVEVVAKAVGATTTTLELADPLHLDFPASRAPQLFHTGTRHASENEMPGTQYAGIEDLSFTGADAQAIFGWNLSYCWIKNIEIDGELIPADPDHPGIGGPGISLNHAYRCVVRDSYVHHSRVMMNNSGSYGIFLAQSSACLIENNISMWWCKPIMLDVSGGGNVVAYNYVDQAVIIGTNWQESAIDLCHQAFSHSDLVEGNWTPNVGADTTHGNSGWMVYFRNFCSGRNSYPYETGEASPGLPLANLRAAGSDAWTRESTYVGNVLTAVDVGGGVIYEAIPSSHPYGVSPVYRMGDNGDGGTGGVWDSGMSASFTYRHGNWDNVSNDVVWDATNPDHTLPDSLYLSSKPGFFGALPWPWVNPATGAVGLLPAKVRYDVFGGFTPLAIFSDGFESGDTSQWSVTSP